MSMAYDPTQRGLTTTYVVDTTNQRYFIPQSAPDASTAVQLQECKNLVGLGKDDQVIASEVVAT